MAGDVSLVEVMARLVAAFAIIIGMLGGAVYVFRRRGMIRVTGGGAVTKRMRVVERQNLSRSTSIAIVRIGTSSYLVGSTDHNVSMLADVTDTIAASDELDASLAEYAMRIANNGRELGIQVHALKVTADAFRGADDRILLVKKITSLDKTVCD